MKNAKNDERNCPTKDEYAFILCYIPGAIYRLREHGMNMLKTYTRQKVLSWGLSVFPLTEKGSPQTEVHSISFAAQFPQISICHCIFWVSF